ncbi:hypothetical protein G6514_006131 [Epicoccum nigrum]|nr:hypothetical protein G6514_006131 [Epicoccum nigrum]
MPRFLTPKKSTEHRVAAIALYRALLSGCSSAALPDDDRTALRNAIRNKFRQNRKLQSPYQLGLSFQLGYETVDKLDTTTSSSAAATAPLSRLIATLPQGLTRAPPAPRPAPRPPPPPHPSGKHPLATLPPSRAVLAVRPYAHVTGQRRVPVLASANGIPFLRLTKPQPASLSRVLRQKLARRMATFHARIELQNYWLPLAQQEDEWDALVAAEATGDRERVSGTADEGCWVDVVLKAREENVDLYEEWSRRDRGIVRRMQGIVDREAELVLKEGRSIVRGRAKAPVRVIKP